jgi:hypothetical protein
MARLVVGLQGGVQRGVRSRLVGIEGLVLGGEGGGHGGAHLVDLLVEPGVVPLREAARLVVALMERAEDALNGGRLLLLLAVEVGVGALGGLMRLRVPRVLLLVEAPVRILRPRPPVGLLMKRPHQSTTLTTLLEGLLDRLLEGLSGAHTPCRPFCDAFREPFRVRRRGAEQAGQSDGYDSCHEVQAHHGQPPRFSCVRPPAESRVCSPDWLPFRQPAGARASGGASHPGARPSNDPALG